ncbi:hypothetical protein BJY52DRAFT_1225506 [Lactarius psammicola]|nr:hypothetical protein BJY52DRAFT_1225506 [Lactarius psammicola]
MWSSHPSITKLRNKSSSTSSSNDPSSSNANHSALPNSDNNSTEDEELENFNLEDHFKVVGDTHLLPVVLQTLNTDPLQGRSPNMGKGCKKSSLRLRAPSRQYKSQVLYKMKRTSSPDHILEERQERQGHDRDYDSGPDDSGTFQSSPQGSSNKLDYGKWQVKITKRTKSKLAV